jgi:hypothetical protein
VGACGEGLSGLIELVDGELKQFFHDLIEKRFIKNFLLGERGFLVEGLK